jgi:hypothetical protein
MSGLTYTTTCPHCAKTFHHAQFETMLGDDGSTISNEGLKVMETFGRHLFEKHPEHWAGEIISRPGYLSTMLLLKAFAVKTQDHTIGRVVNFMRHQLRDFLGFHTPDEKIMAQVVALGLQPEDCDKVFQCMKQLRDVLEERPPFAPQKPGSSNATTNPAENMPTVQ